MKKLMTVLALLALCAMPVMAQTAVVNVSLTVDTFVSWTPPTSPVSIPITLDTNGVNGTGSATLSSLVKNNVAINWSATVNPSTFGESGNFSLTYGSSTGTTVSGTIPVSPTSAGVTFTGSVNATGATFLDNGASTTIYYTIS